MSADVISTPRTPGGAARLQEEERRVVTRSRELLASDRLAMLAGRESKIADESKRTSEALSWLDRRLEADLRAAAAPPGGGRLPFRLDTRDTADVRVPAEVDVAMLASKTQGLPFKSKAEQLKDMIAQREKSKRPGQEGAAGPAPEGESALSADAQRRLAQIMGGSEPSEHGGAEEEEGPRRPHEPGETLGLWAEQHRGSVQRVDPTPFPGLRSLSHAARSTAAPHIAHMYEQIYLEEDPAEATAGGATARTRREPGDDRPEGVTVVLDEEYGNVQESEGYVSDENRQRRSYFEERLLRDVARCVKVHPNRLRIVDVHPGPSWHRAAELYVEMLVVPPPEEERAWEAPSCKAVVEEVKRQAGSPASTLRSGGCSARIIRAEIDRHRRLEAKDGAQRSTGPPLESVKFSLLKGGLSGEVGGARALLAKDHSTEAPQHALYMVNQVLPAAQRNQEGFWIDPAGHRAPQLPRSLYGTWPEDHRTDAPRLQRQWRIMGAGGAIMLILFLWVLYLREDVARSAEA